MTLATSIRSSVYQCFFSSPVLHLYRWRRWRWDLEEGRSSWKLYKPSDSLDSSTCPFDSKMSSSLAILLISLILPTTTATGYIRLDITSSSDADFRLSANLNLDYIRLANGATTSVIVRPWTGARDVEVEFSMYDSGVKKAIFELQKFKNPISEVYIFGDIAVLVEAEFECDPGFVGKSCQQKKVKKDRSFTTTTTTSTSTTTTSTIISTSSESLESSAAPEALYLHVFAISFIITLLILLIVIFAVYFFCFQNQKPQDSEVFKDVTSSPDASKRYTAAPHTMVFISSD